jgi:hypothetical protein
MRLQALDRGDRHELHGKRQLPRAIGEQRRVAEHAEPCGPCALREQQAQIRPDAGRLARAYENRRGR